MCDVENADVPRRCVVAHNQQQRPDKPSKFAQLGTVIEGPTEFKSARLTKKERKNTLLEEVMSDAKVK